MMNKILALTPTTTPDTGWGRYSAGVLSELRDRDRYEVIPWTDLGNPMRFKSLDNPKHILNMVYKAVKLKNKIDEVNPDAILSLIAHPYAAVTYLATSGGRKIPYFVCCHGTYSVAPLYQRINRQLSLRAFRSAEHLFPVSSFTAEKMKEPTSNLTNMTVAKNGLQQSSFEQAEPFDLDHLTILTVGPFKYRKGQKLGIEAFAQVSSQFPDAEYHFIGKTGGNYYNSVQELVDDYGISNKVHFEGFVSEEELHRWYTTADILMFPAQYKDNHHFEGFGLVILEANWYGTPTIGTTCSGAIDAISDRKSGLLTTPDVEDISKNLEQLLKNKNFRDELSKNATDWARKHTWGRTVDVIDGGIQQHI